MRLEYIVRFSTAQRMDLAPIPVDVKELRTAWAFSYAAECEGLLLNFTAKRFYSATIGEQKAVLLHSTSSIVLPQWPEKIRPYVRTFVRGPVLGSFAVRVHTSGPLSGPRKKRVNLASSASDGSYLVPRRSSAASEPPRSDPQ